MHDGSPSKGLCVDFINRISRISSRSSGKDSKLFANSKDGVFEKKAWLEEYLRRRHKHTNIEQRSIHFIILDVS